MINHTSEVAITHGIQFGLLAGLGLTAALGLRYPVKMIPLLLFERTWKAVYLIFFALAAVEDPSDRRRSRRRYQGRADGGNFSSADPVGICFQELRDEARREMEITEQSINKNRHPSATRLSTMDLISNERLR